MAVRRGHAERGQVLSLLARVMMGQADLPYSYVATGMCSALLDLGAVEHSDQIWQAWNEELLDPMHWHRSDIDELLAATREEVTRNLAAKESRLDQMKLHDWIGWWHCFSPEWRERQARMARSESESAWPGRRDRGAAVDVEKQRKAKARKKAKKARAARKKQRRRRKR